jgi:CheY-like chemotaxis protein
MNTFTHLLNSPASHLRARLLIVDDNQLVRELHARVLSLAGYDTETAADGIEALERLADEPFDLVLTDKHMPGLSGANIVLALRSAGSRIPIVMVSGSLAHSPLPDAVSREVFVALPKPARTAEVISAVALALSARPAPARERIRLDQYVEA